MLPFHSALSFASSLWPPQEEECFDVFFFADVCNALFPSSPNKPSRVSFQYKDAFLKALNPEAPNFPSNLGDLAVRLKTWRHTIQQSLLENTGSTVRLEDESPVLAVYTHLPTTLSFPLHALGWTSLPS